MTNVVPSCHLPDPLGRQHGSHAVDEPQGGHEVGVLTQALEEGRLFPPCDLLQHCPGAGPKGGATHPVILGDEVGQALRSQEGLCLSQEEDGNRGITREQGLDGRVDLVQVGQVLGGRPGRRVTRSRQGQQGREQTAEGDHAAIRGVEGKRFGISLLRGAE